MNARSPIPAGAWWRQRFVAIARQAEAAAPRPPAPAGLRVRPRPGAAARRFGLAPIRP